VGGNIGPAELLGIMGRSLPRVSCEGWNLVGSHAAIVARAAGDFADRFNCRAPVTHIDAANTVNRIMVDG